MYRLFVGLRPPLAIRTELAALMGGIPGARWQSDDQLHVTLRFIGAVERPTAEDIATALDQVGFAPLTLRFAGVGQFASRGRPNAVWAGVQPAEPLAALHRKIDQALVPCGLLPERRAYLPHATLARMNAAAGAADRFLEAHSGFAGAPFTVDHFLLFESRLGHQAASYEAVQRYPLRL